MAAGDLTSLANVKQWLNITVTTDDALLTRLITAASAFVQTWLDRTIGSATYTEFRDGNDQNRLMLKNRPVTAVSAVAINGVPIQQAVPLAPNQPVQAGWLFSDKMVYLVGFQFWKGLQNVQIQYTAGFATTPPDIEQATIELISLKYAGRQRIGQISKNLNGEVVAFTQKDMTDEIKTLLQQYRYVAPIT